MPVHVEPKELNSAGSLGGSIAFASSTVSLAAKRGGQLPPQKKKTPTGSNRAERRWSGDPSFIYLVKSQGERSPTIAAYCFAPGAAEFQRLVSLAAYSKLSIVFSHPGQGFGDLW